MSAVTTSWPRSQPALAKPIQMDTCPHNVHDGSHGTGLLRVTPARRWLQACHKLCSLSSSMLGYPPNG